MPERCVSRNTHVSNVFLWKSIRVTIANRVCEQKPAVRRVHDCWYFVSFNSVFALLPAASGSPKLIKNNFYKKSIAIERASEHRIWHFWASRCRGVKNIKKVSFPCGRCCKNSFWHPHAAWEAKKIMLPMQHGNAYFDFCDTSSARTRFCHWRCSTDILTKTWIWTSKVSFSPRTCEKTEKSCFLTDFYRRRSTWKSFQNH